MIRRLCQSFVVLAFAWLAAFANAEEVSCRIAYDMGSSGIRAGMSGGQDAPKADIDFLAPLAAGRNLNETLDAAILALNDLPARAGFSPDCTRVGGGFSAWRLALQRDASELIPALRRIYSATGVHVLVIPQEYEGAYGYSGARQLLGERLRTSHVLDIGGGSLQVAGELTSFGAALGQKVWRRQLCSALGKTESTCVLHPLKAGQLSLARALAQKKLRGFKEALPTGVTMTAISRPVSRGILPALRKSTVTTETSAVFSRLALSQSIERFARLTPDEVSELTGSPPKFLTYLLSDMLLVEGLLLSTGVEFLSVAEIDLTNLPGLLADERAFGWSGYYDCYLGRLQANGLAAYASDQATCR